jgi:hypothetical protein
MTLVSVPLPAIREFFFQSDWRTKPGQEGKISPLARFNSGIYLVTSPRGCPGYGAAILPGHPSSLHQAVSLAVQWRLRWTAVGKVAMVLAF